MRRSSFPGPCLIVLALAIAACSPPAETPAPALAFKADGGTYAWRAGQGTTDSLALTPTNGTGSARPALEIACFGATRGGLWTAAFRAEPVSPPLELTAGDVELAVASRRVVDAEGVAVAGEGDLPAGWLEALASAERLALRYGDQGLEVEGPGRALVETFRRRCGARAPRAD